MSEEALYTPEEISKILKLSKYTIYEMIKRGELPAHHIGRSLRISQDQLDSYLTSTKKAENVFDAMIINDGSSKLAQVSNVQFSVNTPLEGNVRISIKPEDIILSSGKFTCSARNFFEGKVTNVKLYCDGTAAVVVNIGVPLNVLITQKSLKEMGIEPGSVVFALFKTLSVKVV